MTEEQKKPFNDQFASEIELYKEQKLNFEGGSSSDVVPPATPAADAGVDESDSGSSKAPPKSKALLTQLLQAHKGQPEWKHIILAKYNEQMGKSRKLDWLEKQLSKISA